MLVQLVRPLVRSQIQMLAQNPAADSQLSSIVSQWLGYLGVQAEVTQLDASGELIEVSLKVSRPEQCNENEWRQILANLAHKHQAPAAEDMGLTYETMTAAQQSKVNRLLACVLQASNEQILDHWEDIKDQLIELNLPDSLLTELRSAIRVATPMELLVRDLEPEVAAYALSKAIAIALMDQHINQAEDGALKILLSALQQKPSSHT
ncbi:MAG: hypothetical protein F6K00_04085 [Leptolyngbya sp. SIOISBB]|nr:hypothetical protein [Leptolyngbya sp. SIOISBB]